MKDEIYNEEIKERFLNNYPENTRIYYRRIFRKSHSMENLLQKDLYEFNINEIEDVLYDLAPLTLAASQTNGRIITKYITWAIQEGHRSNNINPLHTVGAEWFDYFVDKRNKLYFSKDDIRDIEDNCVNDQDAVIFRLLFEGVSGSAASEIRNLKISNVDFEEGTLRLFDENGEERTLNVESDTLSLIKRANDQKMYLKKNGLMGYAPNNISRELPLIESEYVIKNSKTRVSHQGAVDKFLIYRRIAAISEILEIPNLTTKNILRSGMIYMGKKLYDEEGQLEKPQYEKIARRFKVTNWYVLKQFVNLENIEKLYQK